MDQRIDMSLPLVLQKENEDSESHTTFKEILCVLRFISDMPSHILHSTFYHIHRY